ncbi:hypothetical protein KKF84_05380 [Myxococcota bacterium]|nr:hypothetical protein [Myxococcota bacterium]MBU1534730.1 hypothetical protein [Myxococcota bacterium]
MKVTVFMFLFLAVACGREDREEVSGDTCPSPVVCSPEGYTFQFDGGWGTAYVCSEEEGIGAVYVPQALSLPCVADGDPCGDQTEDCYVPQTCLTTCTVGELECSDGYEMYHCVDGDRCPDPYWAKSAPGIDCP